MKIEPTKGNPISFGQYFPSARGLRNRPEDSSNANPGFKGLSEQELFKHHKGCQPIKPIGKKFTTFTEAVLGIPTKSMVPTSDPKPSTLTKKLDYFA